MINAICKDAGTLILDEINYLDTEGNYRGTAHAYYRFKSAQQLFERAKGYEKIIRTDGNKENGSNYTLKKAEHDFNSAKNSEVTPNVPFAYAI